MKLKEKKEFAENLARYSAIPTFVIDSQHKVLYWNKACEELTGVKAPEVDGTDNHWKAFYDSKRPCLADMVIDKEFNKPEHYTEFGRPDCISSGLHAEACLPDMGGKKRYIVFDAAPIYNSKCELIGALETVQDLTEQKRAEYIVRRKLKIEKAIAAVSSLFVGPTDIDAAIDAALDEIGRLCGASRSYVFLHRENEPVMDNTHEWCNEGVKPQKENLQNLPDDMYPWWMSRLGKNEIIHIPDVSSLPPEAAAEKELLAMQDIQSLLVLPIHSGGELTGFIGLDNVTNTGDWKDYDISALYMVSSAIGMAIERRHAELKLKESEDRYRNLVEAANDGIIIIQKGMLKYINPRTAEMIGLTVKEMIDTPFIDYIHPDKHADILDYYRRYLADEDVPRVYETVVKHKDGSDVDLEFNLSSITYNGEEAAFVILRDITERKLAEDALKFNNLILTTQQETSQDGILVIDNKRRILSFNQRLIEIWGLSPEAIETRSADIGLKSVIGKLADPTAFFNMVEYYYAHPEENTQGEFLLKDGRILDLYSTSMIGKDGKYYGWVLYFRDITERKRAEKKLLESEKRFRDMFENSPVAILESDLSGIKTYIDTLIKNEHIDDINAYLVQHPDALFRCRGMIKVLDVNQPALELFEAGSKSEFIENIDKMFVKESYETFSQEIIAIMNGEKQVLLDTLLRTLSGIIKDAMVQCAVSPGHEDTLSRIQVSFVDISERKRAEKELQKSEERFRNLFENIPVAVMEGDFSGVKTCLETLVEKEHIDDLAAYLADHKDAFFRCMGKGKTINANQAVVDLHEASSKNEFIDNMMKTITSQGSETISKSIVASMNGITKMHTEGAVKTLKGGLRDVVVHWSISPGHEDKISSVLISLTDITERKKAENELHAAHQKLMDIIEFLPDATLVIDAEKKVIAWNRAIEEMTCVKKEDIIGKSDYAYAVPFYGEPRPILIDLLFMPDSEIEEKYKYIEKKGNSLYGETFVPYTYGGKGAHLSGKASPLYDASGKLIGAIESIRDITEQKKAEDNLKKYAEELQDSNELKDLFTDILHHDLLNPAGIVRGYTELLADLENDEKKCRYLRMIEQNNEKLINIIERASKFAKLQTLKELQFKVMDLGVIFNEVIGNFMPKIDQKHMSVEFTANGSYCANVNPIIEEVFANLLANAIKYSPDNSRIIIDITDAGEEWKVSVTDFGEGISDDDKSSLFERFRRVTNTNVKGTGLGLAIVKRLIALHGGSIGVEDNPEGQGSRFWVTLKKA